MASTFFMRRHHQQRNRIGQQERQKEKKKNDGYIRSSVNNIETTSRRRGKKFTDFICCCIKSRSIHNTDQEKDSSNVESGPLTLREYVKTLEPYDPWIHGWRGNEPRLGWSLPSNNYSPPERITKVTVALNQPNNVSIQNYGSNYT